MKSLLEILGETQQYLARHGASSPRTDAEWLIAHALGLDRIGLYLQFDRPLPEADLARIRPLLRRCAAGEPVQYIVGFTDFYNCRILVGPGVLVPRAETERLVDLALERYDGTGAALDLCTGSGCIPFALATEHPQATELVGVEVSAAALAWARRNQAALKLPQVQLLEGDLFAPVAGRRFRLITANPPYVTDAEYPALPVNVRDHEPREALRAGPDGLDVLRRLAAAGKDYLAPDGWLLAELGATQGAAVRELFTAAGWRDVSIAQDYSKHDRVLLARG